MERMDPPASADTPRYVAPWDQPAVQIDVRRRQPPRILAGAFVGRRHSRGLWAAAAVLLLLIGGTVAVRARLHSVAPASALAMRQIATAGVYLEGTAYFDVVHDAARPFIVHTANVITEDVGTQFVVAAYPESRATQVVVAEEAVALRAVGAVSATGVTLPTFPKLSFSYLLSDEPFFPFKELIPTFRVRVAYGRASRQPGITDRLWLYGNTAGVSVDGQSVVGVLLETLSNMQVQPERTTELKGGFDADLLDNRLTVIVTGYRKTTDDALLSVPVLGYADANQDGVLEPTEVLLGDMAVYVGQTLPNYTANLHTTVSLWHGALAVSVGFLYEDGLAQRNTVAEQLIPFSRGFNDPSASLAEQVASANMTVNTTRFNSLAVTYTVPAALARRVGAERLSIAVQGSNLGLWTNYRGLDLSVNAYSIGNNVEDRGSCPSRAPGRCG